MFNWLKTARLRAIKLLGVELEFQQPEKGAGTTSDSSPLQTTAPDGQESPPAGGSRPTDQAQPPPARKSAFSYQERALASGRLRNLPVRANLAFAIRCVRRVQPLMHLLDEGRRTTITRWIDIAEEIARGGSPEPAVGLKESTLKSNDLPRTVVHAVQAAVNLAWAAAATNGQDAASFAAFTGVAAAEAARMADTGGAIRMKRPVPYVLDESMERTPENLAILAAFNNRPSIIMPSEVDDNAMMDLELLSALNLGRANEFGYAVDPGESGPLGSLWPRGVPRWYSSPPTAQELARTYNVYED